MTPETTTTIRSHGFQLGDRFNNTYAHPDEVKTVTASTERATIELRRCHRTCPPMPTSAPIAGASATA